MKIVVSKDATVMVAIGLNVDGSTASNRVGGVDQCLEDSFVLFLGNGEEKNHARERKSLLENTFEALMGAIYLDGASYRMEFISDLMYPFFEKELDAWEKGKIVKDYKSELQQIIQQSGVDTLTYVTVASSGPDHEKIFEVEARLNSNIIGRGKGKTKREAEQNAAKEALALFGEI